jgi:phosphate:Na+ symporter
MVKGNFSNSRLALIEFRRRVSAWANVLLCGGGAAAFLTGLTMIAHDWAWLGSTPGQQVINLHLIFNVTVALIGLILVPLMLRGLALIIRPPASTAGMGERPSAPDPLALADPERAFGLRRARGAAYGRDGRRDA